MAAEAKGKIAVAMAVNFMIATKTVVQARTGCPPGQDTLLYMHTFTDINMRCTGAVPQAMPSACGAPEMAKMIHIDLPIAGWLGSR